MKALLDTHAAVFLWEGRTELFGRRASELLERATLLISPLLRLELHFLREVGKIKVEPETLLGGLMVDCGAVATNDPLEALVPLAAPLSWTRDPFDRLYVATALLHRAPLITRDRRIHSHFENAVW
jgi:PIN domain nuclease of toxin-antitoxin system